MQQFIAKYQDQIAGTLSGFDRLVLRGSLRRLNKSHFDSERGVMVADGMEYYCWENQILFKNYGDYVRRASERMKNRSLKPLRKAEVPYQFVRDSSADKEKLAREIACQRGLTSGPVCVLSALEPSPTFDYIKSRIVRRVRPCHVLYHYQIHAVLGWMYARIQTWFPFNVQIGLNGREWLARQMDQRGLSYARQDNCFPWIEDFGLAQTWMNQQLETNWAELLDSFIPHLNPIHDELFERFPATYYWTCHQCEWANDIVFREGDYLKKRLVPALTAHGMLDFSSPDVLRYFGKRVNQSGEIPARFNGQLQMNSRHYREGDRVKYWFEGNSVKFYDKAYHPLGSVLRAETTTNNVAVFKTYRPAEGGPADELDWRQMRKGVADLHRRTEISGAINGRLVNSLASVDDSHRLEELTAPLLQPVKWNQRRVRALRPWGDDKPLLTAINRGEFQINGFRNRDLQALLYAQPAASQLEQRRRSAAISRKLRMLRAHHLIHKVPHTHRYLAAPDAIATLVAILTSARTSLQQINALQAAA